MQLFEGVGLGDCVLVAVGDGLADGVPLAVGEGLRDGVLPADGAVPAAGGLMLGDWLGGRGPLSRLA